MQGCPLGRPPFSVMILDGPRLAPTDSVLTTFLVLLLCTRWFSLRDYALAQDFILKRLTW